MNLLDFDKSPVLNFFRKKPKAYKFTFSPNETEVIAAVKVVKSNWDEKQNQDPSISDEYKNFQIISKVTKIYPKHDKQRIKILVNLAEIGAL
jgi:hypothetical protein